MGPTIRIGQEILCLPYAGLKKKIIIIHIKIVSLYVLCCFNGDWELLLLLLKLIPILNSGTCPGKQYECNIKLEEKKTRTIFCI